MNVYHSWREYTSPVRCQKPPRPPSRNACCSRDRRTVLGEEVDFIIESGGHLLLIEIKATGRPRLSDAKHLRTFRSEYGSKARSGLLLHTGSTLEWLAPDVLAAPWWRVL